MSFRRALLLTAMATLTGLPAVAFPLVQAKQATPILVEAAADPAVARAADDVASDIERITGRRPALLREAGPAPPRTVVLAGIVGQSLLLEKCHSLNGTFARLRGAWESYAITVVEKPFPGVDRALVVAGSDRRGTIYGLYEISREIGVSPWHWWADVPLPRRAELSLADDLRRFGPPSVKYRGLFLNDEDWGLQPWAAKTFEPEFGDIGPHTYGKVFELLLRLRANTLWPAMHACTKAFFATPENVRLAEAYGIVLGSSHAEPMLRNNVGEWPHVRDADYNYLTNRDGVRRYWEQRVVESAKVDAIYTLGMRGIHDSKMLGPTTDPERIRTLEQIFADQRALLAQHRRPDLEQVPQIFCAYKEVLDLYRQGLRVPDDVTIVWPDDNFGYIRQFASPAEQARRGGSGVYYHLSYLGHPLSYLWLCTTPPALIWEEMHKAWAHGADRVWIANVGDLKPAEIPLTFFLELAWDINRWRPDNLAQFLPDFAARTFGPEPAAEIGAVLADYYRLNFQRKPEHLQWWKPREPRQPSPLTDAEVDARLAAFADLRARTDALRAKIPAAFADAFYELVWYPVTGSALANERYFRGERGQIDAARAAEDKISAETRFFNEQLAGGKWHGLMSLEPADNRWPTMRLARWTPPESARAAVPSPAPAEILTQDAADFAHAADGKSMRWVEIPGLGHTGRAVTLLPTTASALELAAAGHAPQLQYAVEFPRDGTYTLRIQILPTFPVAGPGFRLAVALDDAAPFEVASVPDDGGVAWSQGVLAGRRELAVRLPSAARGPHVLKVFGLTPGVAIDRITIDFRPN